MAASPRAAHSQGTAQSIAAIQNAIEGEIAKLGDSAGIWGVYAVEVGRKSPLVSVNGETLLLPASNRKLFSTAMALRRLGSNYRFGTSLWAVGEVSADGELDGDLVLKASGDPTLRPAFLNGASGLSILSQWSKAVAEAGIKRVSGKVIVDCSLYVEPAVMPPGWAWDQLMELYGALPSVLTVNENRVVLRISPGSAAGAPGAVETTPDLGDALDLQVHCRTGKAGGKNTVQVTRATGRAAILLIGEIPQGSTPMTLTVPIPDPVPAWGQEFGRYLKSAGVEFEGDVEVSRIERVRAEEGPGRRRLGWRESPDLANIVRWTNKESDNQCAEMLYLAAGGAAFGQASYTAAQAAEKQWLSQTGVESSLVVGEDGSGLGRTDLVAAKGIVQLLLAMESGPESEVFLESLPVSGKDGTLEYRMSKGGLKGRVYAKTGTLRDVVALSGYLVRDDGRKVAFSILVNHFRSSAATIRATQDRICGILYDSPLTR